MNNFSKYFSGYCTKGVVTSVITITGTLVLAAASFTPFVVVAVALT